MSGPLTMLGFTWPDVFAFAFFVVAWGVYHFGIEYGSRSGLNASMAEYRMRLDGRDEPARQPHRRRQHLMTSLQNGTAFFASRPCSPSARPRRFCAPATTP